MMTGNVLLFAAALFLVIKGATLSTRYAVRFAESFNLSKYTVGFIVIAVISILPETFISINAAAKDIPAFGLGMLLGSNVADLTIVFALVVFLAGRSLKVESKILKVHVLYPYILVLPILLGLDGQFSRMEGVALIIMGALFYYLALREETAVSMPRTVTKRHYKNLVMLGVSLVLLLVGSHFVVISATAIATLWGVSPILIGMLIVGLGTTMPEFLFALNAAKHRDDALAIGDILGTVLADATVVVGILALLNPFAFPKIIIYIAGVFMVAASFILFTFLRSGRTLTKKEALALVAFWLTFVAVEFIVNA